MAKTKLKNYWALIALIIIANIIIFKYASKKLENYVVNYTEQTQTQAQTAAGL